MRSGLMYVTLDAGRSGRQRFSNAGFAAEGRWRTHGRSQEVTAVQAPGYVAFAGRMGTSAARWAMELEPVDDGQTDANMWIEVDLAGIMRAVPGGILKGRVQRVSDREMAAIKAAVESATGGDVES